MHGLNLNKSKVIKLLLESKTIDSSSFKESYFELNKIKYFNKKKDPLLLYFQMKESTILDIDLFDYRNNRIKLKHYKKLEEDLFPYIDSIKIFDRSLYPEKAKEEEFDEKYLFYWCILTNRFECAKVLWKFGKVIYE